MNGGVQGINYMNGLPNLHGVAHGMHGVMSTPYFYGNILDSTTNLHNMQNIHNQQHQGANLNCFNFNPQIMNVSIILMQRYWLNFIFIICFIFYILYNALYNLNLT